jgi:putative hemolysin
MTPRIEVAWLDIDAAWEENLREIKAYPHSQYPVARDSLDNCLDIVRMKDVLETFQASGTHFALITDEYGGIERIVTLNDLVEAIIGEIPSIEEMNEPSILQQDSLPNEIDE